MVKERYHEALTAFTKVTYSFLKIFENEPLKNDNICEEIVRALMVLLDSSIDDKSQELYVCENGQTMKISDILTADTISFHAFLLGLWHYTIVSDIDNKVGADTFNALFQKGKESQYYYVNRIGKEYPRDIKLSYVELSESGSGTGTDKQDIDNNIEIGTERDRCACNTLSGTIKYPEEFIVEYDSDYIPYYQKKSLPKR